MAFFSLSRSVLASPICHHGLFEALFPLLVALNLEAPTLYFLSTILCRCEFRGDLASPAFIANQETGIENQWGGLGVGTMGGGKLEALKKRGRLEHQRLNMLCL
jgi:hypothetical protein